MEMEKRANRKKLACKDVSLTDQSFAKQANINNIVAKYQKTGILGNGEVGYLKYGDVSQTPSLEAAFEAVFRATEAFNCLPATIRKLLDNDPSQLEIWLSDEKNHKIAEDHGLLMKKAVSSDSQLSGGENEISTDSQVSAVNQATAAVNGETL